MGLTLETKSYRATLVALILIVVIGAVLRFHNLGSESLWLDEAASWAQAKDSLADLIRRTAADNYPPLHNLTLFAAIKLFGDSEWSLRLPSAIFGITNIIALYWLGTLTVGRIAGLLAAVLLAFSPYHFWYSQEARMYSLLALAATLYAATCFHYLRAPSLARGGWVTLAGLALVYSHPYGALDWAAIAAAFVFLFWRAMLVKGRMMLIWVASNAVVAVGFLLWARILIGRAQEISAKGFWIPPSSLHSLYHELGQVLGGKLIAPMILIGVVFGVVGQLRRETAVLCVWIAVPVAIGFMISILSTPILIGRYIIGSLPPLFLLSAYGWTRFARDWRYVMLFASIIAFMHFTLLSYYLPVKEDWRGLASFLNEREQATDCVLIIYGARPLGYYKRNSSCQWQASEVADLPSEMPASVLFLVLGDSEVDPTFPDSAIFLNELQRRGWRELDRVDFRGNLQVRAYVRH